MTGGMGDRSSGRAGGQSSDGNRPRDHDSQVGSAANSRRRSRGDGPAAAPDTGARGPEPGPRRPSRTHSERSCVPLLQVDGDRLRHGEHRVAAQPALPAGEALEGGRGPGVSFRRGRQVAADAFEAGPPWRSGRAGHGLCPGSVLAAAAVPFGVTSIRGTGGPGLPGDLSSGVGLGLWVVVRPPSG